MRWEGLFAELEAEAEALEAADLAGEVAERTRAELARLRLVDRLRPALGHPMTVSVGPAAVLTGRLLALGPDWLLVEEGTGAEGLVPLAAVSWPAKTVVARSGTVVCESAIAIAGRALRAAQPQTEFTTTSVVPGSATTASTCAAVRSSVTPRRVSS